MLYIPFVTSIIIFTLIKLQTSNLGAVLDGLSAAISILEIAQNFDSYAILAIFWGLDLRALG